MFKPGDVVIVSGLLDPQGRNPKDRARVIIPSIGRIMPAGTLDVVAITTLLPNPLPFDHVLLPWQPQGSTRSRTGLNKPNAAVCTWLVEVDESRVARTIGHISGKHLLRIAAVLRALRDGEIP